MLILRSEAFAGADLIWLQPESSRPTGLVCPGDKAGELSEPFSDVLPFLALPHETILAITVGRIAACITLYKVGQRAL